MSQTPGDRIRHPAVACLSPFRCQCAPGVAGNCRIREGGPDGGKPDPRCPHSWSGVGRLAGGGRDLASPRGQGRHRHRLEGAADARPLGLRRRRHGGRPADRRRRLARSARLGHRRRARTSSADQDVVRRFVAAMPREIHLLDHWGIPWTRDEHGRIAQRPFGGHSYPRATLAADKTGFFEMQTLYDQLLRYKTFTRYDEFFVTDILTADGRFAGLLGIHAPSGETCHAARRRPCSSRPAAAARCTASPRTPRPSPATAWPWPTAPVFRSRTWSSSSSTRRGWCRRAF